MTLLFLFAASYVIAEIEEVKRLEAVLGADGIQRVEVVGGSYFFKPNDIVLKLNVPVELKVSKEAGLAPHNITAHSPEAGIDFEVPLGSEAKILTFTPSKVGKYAFFCSRRFLWIKHREKGMEGYFEVVE